MYTDPDLLMEILAFFFVVMGTIALALSLRMRKRMKDKPDRNFMLLYVGIPLSAISFHNAIILIQLIDTSVTIGIVLIVSYYALLQIPKSTKITAFAP